MRRLGWILVGVAIGCAATPVAEMWSRHVEKRDHLADLECCHAGWYG